MARVGSKTGSPSSAAAGGAGSDAATGAGGAVTEADAPAAPVVHFTPTGQVLNQVLVRQLAQGPGAVLLCGRYEGVDQRFLDRNVTLEISLGDFVLSGGELAALVILDAAARHVPGVVGDPGSVSADSFTSGLLDFPVFTRPASFEGLDVPDVLLSGHHAQVAEWRLRQAARVTLGRRPDLLVRTWPTLSSNTRRVVREVAAGEGVEWPLGDGES